MFFGRIEENRLTDADISEAETMAEQCAAELTASDIEHELRYLLIDYNRSRELWNTIGFLYAIVAVLGLINLLLAVFAGDDVSQLQMRVYIAIGLGSIGLPFFCYWRRTRRFRYAKICDEAARIMRGPRIRSSS